MKLDKNKKILIIGLGLIGGSYAKGLSAAGYTVGAIDTCRDSIDYALEYGYIKSGSTETEKEYVGEFDILIFALYPHIFIEWVEKYQSFIKSGALLTDVTGVKCSIVDKIQLLLRPDLEFIGAHPMAGREVSGVRNATDAIFKNANYIVTPSARNTASAIETAEALARVLGFGKLSRLSPEKHDEMIGFLSQLTHCIAVALMTCKESKHLAEYTGDSFRDLTRIAKINEDMWSELFFLNRDELISQMELFLNKFTYIKDCLVNGDEEGLKATMRLSTENRKYFDK